MKLPPVHKNYALAALPGGGKSPLPKKESNVMAIVFLGVVWPKRHHPGKPSPKPCPLAAIIDLNLTINHKWVMAREIGSEWGADAPHPIFPSLTCWSTNPDLKGGQVTAYRTTIGGICKLSKYCIQDGPPHQDVPKGFKLLDSAFSPLQFPGNLPPPAEMIPETFKIECESIYTADSLILSQMKVFLMYLCIIFCCTFPYSLFKGYHLRVNTHHLLLIDYNKLSLLYPDIVLTAVKNTGPRFQPVSFPPDAKQGAEF
ncbi:hypothetical protein DSO57_1018085 [Entomophthora muscae]|uniref:Uncharacterized protein n=1 Tax=Entomophthora muscae TaxID=34485 RepID=A0ACC2RVH2_9FUNG|nr:hypothetical protein DSO57_1018085 [Entomophthora muscae]